MSPLQENRQYRENGFSRVNGSQDNGNIVLNNVHNVHAPMMSNNDLNGGGGQRFCPSPSPSSTMPRRTESPAPSQRPGSSQSLPRGGSIASTASPAFNRSGNFSNQVAPPTPGQAQTQGRINVASTEDIDYSSNKPKKVGNSFQWPPPRTQEEQGPTAAPIYINPNSRTSSPAPRNLSSPAPAITPLAMRSTSSPARSTLASPTPVTHSGINNGSQFTSPAPGLTTPSRSSLGSPSPAIQSPAIQ